MSGGWPLLSAFEVGGAMVAESVKPRERDVLAGEVSSVLLRRILHRRGWTVKRLKAVEGLSEDMVTSWFRRHAPATIAPPCYYPLTKALRLLDFELEGLMTCTFCEYRPYWTDDGREADTDSYVRLDDIGDSWGMARSRVQQICDRALRKMRVALDCKN